MIYCYYLWQNWWGLIGQSLLAFFSLAASKVISKASVFTSLLCGLGRLKGLESESRSVVSDSLWLCGLYSPYNSPGQNTRVGSLSLLQGIFPTQGLKPRSPTLQVDSLPAEPPGKPQMAGDCSNWKLAASLFLWGLSLRVLTTVASQ